MSIDRFEPQQDLGNLTLRAQAAKINDSKYTVRFYISDFKNHRSPADSIQYWEMKGRLILSCVDYLHVDPAGKNKSTLPFHPIDDNTCATPEIIFTKTKNVRWPPENSTILITNDNAVVYVTDLTSLLTE